MSLVIGTGAIILFYSELAAAWVPYGCARGGSIDVSTQFLNTSITGQGVWETVLPTSNSGTGMLDGLHNLETIGLISIADLQEKQFNHVKLLMRFDYTTDAGKNYVLQGYFYISDSRINHSFDNVSTFNVDLRLTGPLTQSFVHTQIIRGIVIRKEFIIPAGQDDITISDVDGITPDNILLVTLNGVNYEDMILTGIPVNLVGGSQFLYNQSGGKFVFPSAVPVDTNGILLYQTFISGS